MKKQPGVVFGLGLALIVALFAGLTWANYRFTKDNAGGNDFIPRYVGTQNFLLKEGQSPYSDATTQDIQKMIFGRAALETEDQSFFVYPHYSMLFFAPFSLVEEYAMARALWMTVLELSILAIAFIALRIFDWKLSPLRMALYLLFAFSWYHAMRPLFNGNPSILVALFVALSLYAIETNNDRWAGAMLAFATIKPQAVIFLIVFTLLWAVSRRRIKIVSGFVVTLIVLVIGSMLIQQDWIIANLRQILSYPGYTEPGTAAEIFSLWWPKIGKGVASVWNWTALLLLLWSWALAWNKGTRVYFWTAMMTLVLTTQVGIYSAASNFILLFPAIPLLFSTWEARWPKGGKISFWINLLLLWVGLWWLHVVTLIERDQPVQNPIMLFVLPVYLIVALLWSRWWAVKPARLPIDEVKRVFKQL